MRSSNGDRHDRRSLSRTVALVLSMLLGRWGGGPLLPGHPVQGVLELISFGGCGLWWALDVLRIATGSPRDARGREPEWEGAAFLASTAAPDLDPLARVVAPSLGRLLTPGSSREDPPAALSSRPSNKGAAGVSTSATGSV